MISQRLWLLPPISVLVVLHTVLVLVGLTASNLFAQSSGESSPYGSEYDSGYGNESGAPPPPPPPPKANLTTGRTPMSLYQLIQPNWNPLRQEIARVLAPSTTPAIPPMVGPLLRNEANVAFRYGNLPLARELYFGFLANGTEDANEDLEKLKFSRYFSRPAWQLRWGVSVGVHGDTDVDNFAPIQPDGADNGMNGMEMANSYDSSGLYDSSDDPGMSSSQGSSVDSGYESQSNGMSSSSEQGGYPQLDSNGRPIDPSASVNVAPKAQMTDPTISARFEEMMGYVATTVSEGMQTRMASGQFGEAFAGIEPEVTDQGDMVDGEYVEPREPRMWIPSVVYLGEGSSQEMSKAAAMQRIELLLHFDVAMKNVRNSTPQNATRVKVIDGRSGRTLITSDQMDNREVLKMLQNKRGTVESYVNDALEKFWSVLDSKLSVEPFPTLPPASARGRVTGVLGDPTFSLLRKLAEIQYMGKKKWLTEDEVEQAYSIAAGSDGMRILYGSESEAISVIHEIVKRSAK